MYLCLELVLVGLADIVTADLRKGNNFLKERNHPPQHRAGTEQ